MYKHVSRRLHEEHELPGNPCSPVDALTVFVCLVTANWFVVISSPLRCWYNVGTTLTKYWYIMPPGNKRIGHVIITWQVYLIKLWLNRLSHEGHVLIIVHTLLSSSINFCMTIKRVYYPWIFSPKWEFMNCVWHVEFLNSERLKIVNYEVMSNYVCVYVCVCVFVTNVMNY